METVVFIVVVFLTSLLLKCAVSAHSSLDEEEERFKYGDKIEITSSFFKGRTGTILKLHPATSLSHGWVGYWIKLDDGTELEDAIPVDDLKALHELEK